jgi:hypothetical protein
MTDILPCPMCGSTAKLDSSGVIEAYGKDWQTMYIECTMEKDPHCGMTIDVSADFWNIRNATPLLIEMWNKLDRK